jgi:hypothetical protein
MQYGVRSKVFKLRLGAVGTFGRWPAGEPVVIGRKAFGTGWDGAFFKVRLPDGEINRVRRFPSPVTYALEVVR